MKTIEREQEELYLDLANYLQQHGWSFNNIVRDEDNKPYVPTMEEDGAKSRHYLPTKYQEIA